MPNILTHTLTHAHTYAYKHNCRKYKQQRILNKGDRAATNNGTAAVLGSIWEGLPVARQGREWRKEGWGGGGGLLKGLQTTFFVCAQNKYKSVETKTFCNNIKIANETEQKTVAEGYREGKGGDSKAVAWGCTRCHDLWPGRAGVYWQQCCYLCKRLVKFYIAAVLFFRQPARHMLLLLHSVERGGRRGRGGAV